MRCCPVCQIHSQSASIVERLRAGERLFVLAGEYGLDPRALRHCRDTHLSAVGQARRVAAQRAVVHRRQEVSR